MSDAPRLLEFDFVKKLAVPFFERANTASHADLLAQRENMFVHYYQSAIQGKSVKFVGRRRPTPHVFHEHRPLFGLDSYAAGEKLHREYLRRTAARREAGKPVW